MQMEEPRRVAGQTSPTLTEVFLEQREALARFCRARFGNQIDAEDLLQDLFLKVSALPPQASVREPRAFLYRLLFNLMLDRRRSALRGAARDGAWRQLNRTDVASEEVDETPSAEASLAGRQRVARLLAAVETLPERPRAAFRLHKLEGLSHAQVAERMGVSKSSVEKYLIEALRVLAARVPR